MQMNHDDWDKIINRAFSPDAPDPKFSRSYQKRKKEILKQAEYSAERSISMKKSRIGFTVLTACVASMAGLAIYGGMNIYQMGHSITHDSEISSLSPAQAVEADNILSVTQSIPDFDPANMYTQEIRFQCQEDDYTANGGQYDIKAGWIPENSNAIIAKQAMRVNDVSEPYTESVDDVLGSQEFMTASGNEAIYLVFNQDSGRLYVHFTGTPYIAQYTFKDTDDATVQKFADGLYIEPMSGNLPDNKLDIVNMPYIGRVEFQCQEDDYTANGGYYHLVCNWIPEGLECREDGAYGGKYHNYQDETSEKAITPEFCRIADVSQPYINEAMWCVDRLETELDSYDQPKHVILISRDAGYDQLFVHFEGTPYVAAYWINDFTQEEAIQLAENMELVKSDHETAYLATDSVWTIDKAVDIYHYSESEPIYVDPDQLHLVHVGDTINKAAIWGTSEYHEYPDIQLTINDAVLQKNFDGVATDGIGRDYHYDQYLDENGEFYVNRVKLKPGNGITTLDEIIENTRIQQYILKLDLTLTRTDHENEEESFDNGLCFQGESFTINDDGIINSRYYDFAENVEISRDSDEIDTEMFFSFATDHEHQKNGIYDLAPGESADVTLCYLVDADQIGKLYINLMGNEFTVNMGMPVLDLTDLTAPE